MIHSASADNCLAITGHVHRDSRHFYTAGIYALKLLLVFRQTLSKVLYPCCENKDDNFPKKPYRRLHYATVIFSKDVHTNNLYSPGVVKQGLS